MRRGGKVEEVLKKRKEEKEKKIRKTESRCNETVRLSGSCDNVIDSENTVPSLNLIEILPHISAQSWNFKNRLDGTK